MSTISTYSRSCLNMQGFTGLEDDAKARLNIALRFTPALCFPLATTGVVLGSPWLLGALAVMAAAALVLPGGHPFDSLYNHGVRRLTRTPWLPRNPRPRQFALLMAAAMLGAAAFAFGAGAVLIGRVLGAMQLIGCGVYLFGGLCLGSWVYGKLLGGTAGSAEPVPSMRVS